MVSAASRCSSSSKRAGPCPQRSALCRKANWSSGLIPPSRERQEPHNEPASLHCTGDRHPILDHPRHRIRDHLAEGAEGSLALLGVLVLLGFPRLAGAITFAVHLEDMAAVRQPIQ